MRKENATRQRVPPADVRPARSFRNNRRTDVDAVDDRRSKAGPIDSETTQLDAHDMRPAEALLTAFIARCFDSFPGNFPMLSGFALSIFRTCLHWLLRLILGFFWSL
jgi:hypothetical protein